MLPPDVTGPFDATLSHECSCPRAYFDEPSGGELAGDGLHGGWGYSVLALKGSDGRETNPGLLSDDERTQCC
ncbi:hypothetical protein MMAG44476_17272 [Mycolicibacterium mageritense DSM 44476 = CIP 104973]|uniref:Uncharacterized protein n=1 Tax=Mycolicibacterium mageritense TaxID=53462 RepID=A0AAI8TNJ5_MYCME|nr:hypothetical protein [Mycolicibacterium mageritense]MCC9180085.1 hypothetical protein [Mycolicibacterium mageritense]BBX33378.1 hypothetical protein MMAGJ_26600 [Mycolicibacterium mageritense]BDY28023.1 hypothetical protein hbim_01953 [Mycolicibacterium mageritense]CDO21811.1 hypothetical protein BN978_02275 [Mycolicibacterium mageritense DSM 44476 = CIP 104973]